MNKVNRRDAIKAFAGAGIVLAASPALLNVAAARPEVTTSSAMSSTKLRQVSPIAALKSSGLESVVIHLKDGKLVAYKGMHEFSFSDDDLVARITEKFGV